MLDVKFLIHNLHHESVQEFEARDPNLRKLKSEPYHYISPLLTQLPTNIPGIFTLGGGRQVGKTTFLKQWMLHLLEQGVEPNHIAFLTGDLIENYNQLFELIKDTLALMAEPGLKYLLIDEVTYIGNWDKAIKFAADSGYFEAVVVMLTGSDLALMKSARMTFPGRRGKADQVDYHLYPLSFREVVGLTNKALCTDLKATEEERQFASDDNLQLLMTEFNKYLLHGGYLTAINDLARDGCILPATLKTYSDWIRGDVLKRDKQEHYLREILSAIIKHYGSQVSWHTLSEGLSIDHHKTVADYVELLVQMDAVFVQYALQEDKLMLAPKKAKKLMFNDPFIFHAIYAWLNPSKDPFQEQMLRQQTDNALQSLLVEACVVTHYRRFYETFYIKAEGEVDVAYIDGNQFWPIEAKWTSQIRPKDLKQISKYSRGVILGKPLRFGDLNGVNIEPLVWHLYWLDTKTDSERV